MEKYMKKVLNTYIFLGKVRNYNFWFLEEKSVKLWDAK